MTSRKKWGLFLLLVLFAVITTSAVLSVRLFLPIQPTQPYFPVAQTRLPQSHWLFGRFQPVFFYPFSRGDSVFLKVAYRSPDTKIRLLDVYVGALKPTPSLAGVAADGKPNQISKISDYWQYLRPGDRISLTYLRTVTPRPGTGAADAILPSAPQGQEVCAKLPAFCLPAQLAESHPDPFWDFAATGTFPIATLFPVIGITTQLLE
jgi:hypothetical protein